ncbi:MAG: OsmC family peroxiredoxin [Armatimonadota bacterium]
MPVKTAKTKWIGDFRSGRGIISPGSSNFEADYCFNSITGEGPGTSPVEMLTAAVSGCFTSTLSGALTAAGYAVECIESEAKAYLDKVDGIWAVTQIELHVQADVPGIDESIFLQHVHKVAKGCPVSKAVSSVEMVVSAELV